MSIRTRRWTVVSEDEQERTRLSWKIIEWKVAYYKPECVHPQRRKDYEVTDDEYDAAEVRYLTLCRQLGHRNSVVHKKWPGFEDLDYSNAMMEVDETRPSVQLVMAKLNSPKPRKRKRKAS
jgi:hypothetical protein